MIISRIKKIFPNIHEINDVFNENSGNNDMGLITVANPTFNELIAVIRRRADGQKVNSFWAHVYKWYMDNDNWREKCNNVLSGVYYTNQVENVSSNKIRKLYGSPLYSSVSRVERYIACPF